MYRDSNSSLIILVSDFSLLQQVLRRHLGAHYLNFLLYILIFVFLYPCTHSHFTSTFNSSCNMHNQLTWCGIRLNAHSIVEGAITNVWRRPEFRINRVSRALCYT